MPAIDQNLILCGAIFLVFLLPRLPRNVNADVKKRGCQTRVLTGAHVVLILRVHK